MSARRERVMPAAFPLTPSSRARAAAAHAGSDGASLSVSAPLLPPDGGRAATQTGQKMRSRHRLSRQSDVRQMRPHDVAFTRRHAMLAAASGLHHAAPRRA